MSKATFRFDKADRSLMERLFEPSAVGKMSPAASLLAHGLLVAWSVIVLFPIYWVIITSFKDAAAVNQGPFYVPFLDFEPTLDAWRSQFISDPYCDVPSIVRQVGLLAYNSFAFILSPVVTLQPMEPQICKIFLAFTNSIVISIAATAICIVVGAMAAYALARIQYRAEGRQRGDLRRAHSSGHRRNQLCRRAVVACFISGVGPFLLPRAHAGKALRAEP